MEGEDRSRRDGLFGRAPHPPEVRPSSLLEVQTWGPWEGKYYLTFASWEVVQVHSTGYWLRLPLPSLDGSHLDQWGCSNILVPTSHCFLFIFPHCSYPYNEENQLKKKKKKKKKKRRDGNEIKWTILTSTSSLHVTKVLCSRHWAESLSCQTTKGY